MTNVIEIYYKRELDSIAAGYIETILKSSKVWFKCVRDSKKEQLKL